MSMKIINENQSRNLNKLTNQLTTDIKEEYEEKNSIIKNLSINTSNIFLIATATLYTVGFTVTNINPDGNLGTKLMLSSIITLISGVATNEKFLNKINRF